MNVHHTPEKSKKMPPQHQRHQPGVEREMRPRCTRTAATS
jgi:hypothetical protein